MAKGLRENARPDIRADSALDPTAKVQKWPNGKKQTPQVAEGSKA